MFKAMHQGTFGVLAVNRKLRELWTAIEEIRAHIGMTDGEAETVAEAPVTVTETVAEQPKEEEPAFDWKTSDDVPALKAFALETFGLEIKGNKKAETVRSEIMGFIEVQGA